MPRIWCFVLTIVGGALFADEPQTLVSLRGERFERAHITNVTPATITIVHSVGVAIVLLSEFPPDVQKRYGYDEAKAKAWLEQIASQEKAQREREEAERAAAAKREADAKYQAGRRHAEGIEESI